MLNVSDPIANHVPPKPDGKHAGTPALRIRSLSKSFGKFVALDGIDLDIEQGEFVCFLGPSGCGKTTLLRAIAGLDPQDHGTIHQNGRDISRLPVGRRDFGIVFQSYALFPNLTVERNVGYGLHGAGVSRQQRHARIGELLELVGLQSQSAKYPAQLSGGQQQRVALARALAPSPGLLLLDEPLSALDAQVRLHLRDQLRQLQRSLGVTTIMVTHDQDEALATADRIVVMNQGEIEQVGTPEEVFSQPASPFVAGFLGDMNFIPAVAITSDSVTLAGMTVDIPKMEDFAPGSEVSLCIRPADIAIKAPSDSIPGCLEGVVEASSFRGNFYRLSVRCARIEQMLDVELTGSAWQDLGLIEGSPVGVAFPPTKLHVFPRRP
ncbi:putative 2-aminoethylphosphonate ABC transporter ATP-binding protein [Pseudaminobacter salicylatoxidans]|uniref:putative 2-aminoethylphosphonate ABC transporter ATP-binding protein n=1 Tax=Pseudaminobacter salicylatoxidans TaxID=93369 RepID=UPI0003791CBF|nr:putative 2-aminoethylphosphonate ABC transporter ATP-binding protein [Pseudaminobacter salicylatoxidans]